MSFHQVRATCHCSQCDFYFRVWANSLLSHELFLENSEGDTQPIADSPPPSQLSCPTEEDTDVEDLTAVDDRLFVEVLMELGVRTATLDQGQGG